MSAGMAAVFVTLAGLVAEDPRPSPDAMTVTHHDPHAAQVISDDVRHALRVSEHAALIAGFPWSAADAHAAVWLVVSAHLRF